MDERLRERRLLERATFGPRPGELGALRSRGAEAWLHAQLAQAVPADPALGRRLGAFRSLLAGSFEDVLGMQMPERPRAGKLDPEARKRIGKRSREVSHEVVGARVVRAVHGEHGLREVMIDFWSNHFSVFARKGPVGALLPSYQQEVLEPHALGSFEDLLVASAKSAAMLFYLDNWISTRPDLPRWARREMPGRASGINENYARELLELHTLGVHGGYGQDDVVEVARVLTGWGLESRRDPRFRFREGLHDPGAKRVLGERVPGAGIEQGEWLLRRLARHPSTARHLARKLVVRFVTDEPPPALVERVARRFLETGGEIRAALEVVLLAPELADPGLRKLKTPLRLAASALRATGGETDGGPRTLLAIGRLGELPFFARTPAGFPEDVSYWVDPGAMLERMGLAFALARGLRGTRLGPVYPEALGTARAGVGREQLALAIASPEFQWA